MYKVASQTLKSGIMAERWESTVDQAIAEAAQWLATLEADPPPGWIQAVLSDHRSSLDRIQSTRPDSEDDAHELREQLADYCARVRRALGL